MDCECWKKDPSPNNAISVESGFWPELVNVVGGESLNDEKLFLKLKQLKKCGKHVRLWTNGIQLPNFWDKLKSWVDEVMLYCPSHHPEGYRHITGNAHFRELVHAIECISEDPKQRLCLNVPIKPYNVMYMQDIYDTFYHYSPYYFFHYNKYDNFEAESIRYIKRFSTVQNCFVLRKKIKEPLVCDAYPYALENTVLQIPAHMLEWTHKLRQKWGATAIYRKVLN